MVSVKYMSSEKIQYVGRIFREANFPRGELCWGQFSVGEFFPVANCQGRNVGVSCGGGGRISRKPISSCRTNYPLMLKQVRTEEPHAVLFCTNLEL